MIERIYTETYRSPCGELLLGSLGDKLCLCDWTLEGRHNMVVNRVQRLLHARLVSSPTPVTTEASNQLNEYFAKGRREFSVPLQMAGSEFQVKVWEQLLNLPYGTTITYSQLAQRMGNSLAVRAVAGANRMNALSIFIPCHRVIGQGWAMTGYAGGIETKRYLLHLESPDKF